MQSHFNVIVADQLVCGLQQIYPHECFQFMCTCHTNHLTVGIIVYFDERTELRILCDSPLSVQCAVQPRDGSGGVFLSDIHRSSETGVVGFWLFHRNGAHSRNITFLQHDSSMTTV